jgi:HNH endonuclease
MAEGRPKIPAELHRKVLVEAGHRCAIPTCRYIQVDIHHIIPWEKCQAHEYDNLIALCSNCHKRADNAEIDRKALKIYKANLRFAHDKFSQLEIDVLFELHPLPLGHAVWWPPYLYLLVKRLLDAGYVELQSSDYNVQIGAMQLKLDYLLITDAGRSYVDNLGLDWAGD